jgi:hypothetical protein
MEVTSRPGSRRRSSCVLPEAEGCRRNARRLVVVFGHVLFVDWVRPALAGEFTEYEELRHAASDCPCRNPLE